MSKKKVFSSYYNKMQRESKHSKTENKLFFQAVNIGTVGSCLLAGRRGARTSRSSKISTTEKLIFFLSETKFFE